MVGRVLASICVLALVSCGGGSVLRPATGTNPGTNQSATATVRFVIPGPSDNPPRVRKPAFVSPSIQSASITVSGIAQPFVANLTPTSPNCAGGGGGVTCTISVGSPTGTVMFTVRTYDGLNAQGNLLSTGSATATVTMAGPNTVNLALNGAVSRLGLALMQPLVPAGSSATTQLVVQALDAQNNVIIGTGSYVDTGGNPLSITVTDPDSSGATHINGALSATVTAPSNASLTLTSTGGLASGATVQFTASAPGMTTATALLGFGTPATTIYVAENNFSQINAYFPGQSGNAVPFRAILPTLGYPEQLTYDASGRIYVTDDDGNRAGIYQERINVYAANVTAASGNAAPVQQIAGPATGLTGVYGIAIDASGRIWVANYYSACPTGLSTIRAARNHGAGSGRRMPEAIPSCGSTGFVAVFAPGANGNVAPLGLIQGSATLLTRPLALAFDPAGNLWVSNSTNLYAFSPAQLAVATGGGTLNQAPSMTLTVSPAVSAVNALAIDASGNTYVAGTCNSTSTVSIFAAGATGSPSPVRSLTGTSCPEGIAFDGTGNVYVSGYTGTGISYTAVVNTYTAGTTGSATPASTITEPLPGGANCFAGLGVYAGRIDVLDNCALALYSYPVSASGAATPTRTIQTYHAYPGPLWEDSSGNLYVANGAIGGVAVFAAGASGYAQPTRFLFGLAIEYNPLSVVTDTSGNLYTLNNYVPAGTPNVFVYGPGANGSAGAIRSLGGAATTLTARVYGKPQLDPSGNLVIADAGRSAIDFFAPNASGNVAPIQTISGAATTLNSPRALFVDSTGTVYVAQIVSSTSSTAQILVFPAGQYGNVSPVRTITSTFTGAYYPRDLWVDGAGTIYVATTGTSEALLTFAPGANGSVSPAVLTGNLTQLSSPSGVAVGL